jgi:hypothetical protein
MWTKLGQLLITYLLLPLAERGIAALIKAFQKSKKTRERLENAESKIKKYKESKSKKDHVDSFNKLP